VHAIAPPDWPRDAGAAQIAVAGRRARPADVWRLFLDSARAGRPVPPAGRSLDAIYGPVLRAHGRFVVAQVGQSLDGRIATVTGASHYINGSAALDHLHRLRACVDAVVVGIGTVLADDPQLTVRRCIGDNPTRVVIDPRGRLPAGARCLGAGADIVVVREPGAPAAAGGETIRIGRDEGGRLPPGAIVAALAARGLKRILVEGGASTVSHFLAADSVDRLHVAVAPLIIGSGIPGFALPPVPALDEALRPPTAVHMLDDGNVLFDCDIAAARRPANGGRDGNATAEYLSPGRPDPALDNGGRGAGRDPARDRHAAGPLGSRPGHAV
jgi:diaminohydroxyphosphoribosylaminopyrimidine deaminase/5-amino-6-(5-phosphoribosylamino)uracil reductase